jgi:acetyl esterase/lipase
MSSLSNWAFLRLLRVSGGTATFSSAQAIREKVAQQQRQPDPFAPPRRLLKKAVFTTSKRHGWTTYDVKPTSGPAYRRVLYFHGGGYVCEIVPLHWRFITSLVRKANVQVIVPVYPLAPAATATTTVAIATALAAELLASEGPPVVFMGDSAGAGLALAVAEQLRDAGVQPSHIFLLSPFLDVAANDPRMVEIEPRDPMLSLEGLGEAGRLYACDVALDDPLASPLWGDLKGLAPVTVFAGTNDVLLIDAQRFVEKAEAQGVDVTYEESQASPHVYVLFPTKEGKKARNKIWALLHS